jgi:poly-beta-1,6-N-acetyl-D-glucosamine synthase
MPREPGGGRSDFRARPRHIPGWMINGLAALTLAYGLVLCALLPWVAVRLCMDAPQVGPMLVWALALVLLGTVVLLRWLIVQALAFCGADRARRRPRALPADPPLVSILVPAFNESDTVVDALRSLLELDYPAFDIVFVDDGSTDDTFLKALPLAGPHPNGMLHVLTKPNGGKWSALNYGFSRARGSLILCVDADSRLARDALRAMVPRLLEPGVVACSGQVMIRNRDRLLTCLQATEYLVANGGLRMAQNAVGAVTVVPGPIGLYRREVMDQVARIPAEDGSAPPPGHTGPGAVAGPLSSATFAEDFHLSLSALVLGGRIVYEPRAYAYTKCPDTILALLNQRYRWIRGTWQVYALYARYLSGVAGTNTRARLVATVMHGVYPIDLMITPAFNFYYTTLTCIALAQGRSLALIGTSIGAMALLNAMAGLVHVLLQDEEFGLVPLMPLLDYYVGILVNAAWVIALVDQLRRTAMRWS